MIKITFPLKTHWLMSFIFLTVLFGTTSVVAQNPGCTPTPGFPEPPPFANCTPANTTVVFTETFDTGFGAFTEDPAPGGNNDLTLSTNGDTPSSGTGSECNPEGMSGPEYIFLEGSSTQQFETHCMSATIDLTAETAPLNASFWYYMFGDTIGDLEVIVNGTQQFIVSGQQQNDQELPWLQGVINFDAYAGTMVTVQICMTEGSNAVSTFESDISIDHFQIFGCSQITDPNAPIINCPGDVTLNTTQGACDAPFGFATPTGLDPNGGNVTVVQTMGPPSPGPFPVGDTVVEFTATNDDAPNEVTTCQFTVTVVDNQVPTITCPDDVTMTNDPTLCGADVIVGTPTIMDNCPVVANNPPPVAQSPVTDFIFNAAGLDDTPTTITGTQMSVGGDVIITVDFIGDFGLTSESFVLNGPDGMQVFNNSSSLTDCAAAQDTFTIAEAVWNNYVTTFGPDLDFVLLADPDVDGPNLCAPDNNYQLTAQQGDATAGSTLSNDFNGTNNASDFYPVGTTVVTWTYTDEGGNSAQCTMNVTVTDDEAPEVNCIGGPIAGTGSATGTGGAIPDNNPAGLTTTLDVTEDFDITDLDVNLDINHTWMGDLAVRLTAPDGTTIVQLIDRPGVPATAAGCNNINPAINVDLDDEAALTIEDSCPEPFVGSFIPNEALSAFDGISTMGTWTLFITDSAGGDAGSLNSWTLNYSYNATTSPPLEVFLDIDGMAVVPSGAFVSSISDNCGIASIEVVGGITVPNIDECGDNVGGVIDGSAPTESAATVADSGLVGPDYTLDNVEIDITHTFDGDLEIELISPTGTALMLSDNNGGGGDNYTDTVFMDGGADINGGSAPFTGTFAPEGGTFAATFAGEEVNGDWILRVTDTFALGDDGTLDSFCISFIPVNPSAALFTCEDVGTTTVDILVTDIGGNTAMCTASVTVIDNIEPILVCQNFTLELGPDGTAMLDPMDLIDMNLTIEACGIAISGVSMDDFTCDDIGTPQVVTLFVSDPSGNLASCEATVTVVDALGPEVICPADMTIDPGANNQLYEVPDYFADGLASATDNCTDPVTVFAQDPAAGSFIGDGVYTVTLSAFDEYGNEGTCTFELTIESILGVDDNTLDAGVTLYPNPAQDQVILSNSSNILLKKATMYDVNGKLVSTTDLTNMTTEKTIDISQLASGVYIVQIEGENANVVKRLIKK